MTFRVDGNARNRTELQRLRAGDRVQVAGDLVADGRIAADQITFLGRGPARTGALLSGTIRTLDRGTNRMTVATPNGNVRLDFDEETDWFRGGQRSLPRDFRVGEEVRISGRRAGEGAYFAPELGNVWIRYSGNEDKEGARAALIAWMQSQPSGVPGRRQMPQFHLTDQELNDLIDFLEWTSRTNLQGWPPNKSG